MESWSDRDETEAGAAAAPRPYGDRLRAALDAIAQALAAPALSLDHVRHAVIRYGRISADQALHVDEMIAALTRGIRDALETLPDPRRADVLASVQWWAVHGFHRAD